MSVVYNICDFWFGSWDSGLINNCIWCLFACSQLESFRLLWDENGDRIVNNFRNVQRLSNRTVLYSDNIWWVRNTSWAAGVVTGNIALIILCIFENIKYENRCYCIDQYIICWARESVIMLVVSISVMSSLSLLSSRTSQSSSTSWLATGQGDFLLEYSDFLILISMVESLSQPLSLASLAWVWRLVLGPSP